MFLAFSAPVQALRFLQSVHQFISYDVYLEGKRYKNNFQERDFLRDLKFPMQLCSREKKAGFSNHVKNCVLESCSNIFFSLKVAFPINFIQQNLTASERSKNQTIKVQTKYPDESIAYIAHWFRSGQNCSKNNISESIKKTLERCFHRFLALFNRNHATSNKKFQKMISTSLFEK